MSNKYQDIINHAMNDQPVNLAGSFADAMNDKITDRIASARIEVAQDMVGAEEVSGDE